MREKLAGLSSQEKGSKTEIEKLRMVEGRRKSERDNTDESEESWESINADKYDDVRSMLEKELK